VSGRKDSYATEFQESRQFSAAIHTDSSACDPLTVGPNDHDSGHLFGKSSSASFIHSLKRTIVLDGDGHTAQHRHDHQCSCKSSARFSKAVQSKRRADTSAFSLPLRKEADRYMYCFWQYVHSVAPILHEPSFTSSYRSIWLSEDEQNDDGTTVMDDPLFLATLSIVFAIGCQYDETVEPNRKANLTERLYLQSRTLAKIEEMDTVSILTVQFLLLTGFYLLNSKFTNRCWNVIGLAIRNAQSLGLHDETRSCLRSQIDRETRRRVWYNCVYMDR
jgi:hypothetical protein